MNDASPWGSLLRDRRRDGGKVAMVELFFDLVFVFAVTQLSHSLLADLSPRHAFEVALLMAAVWWVWIFTSWVTNWLDPERTPVRLALFVMMLVGLVLSASLPKAWGDRGAVFAMAYVGLQVGRTIFFLACVPPQRHGLRRNFLRILVWLSVAGVFWITGAALEGDGRLACWVVALGLELVSPALYFFVPGLGRSSLEDWDVDGGHLSERCALFMIIALGESLLVSGATFAEAAWTPEVLAALACAIVGSVAMWWLYFHRGAEAGHHRIAHDAAPGRHARLAYTYLHLPIVAGVIVAAVADELVLAHPGHADAAGVIAILGGPALFLVGVAAFKWTVNARPRPPLSHLVGLALLAALAVPGGAHLFSAVQLAAAATAVLVLVAVWEELSLGAPAA